VREGREERDGRIESKLSFNNCFDFLILSRLKTKKLRDQSYQIELQKKRDESGKRNGKKKIFEFSYFRNLARALSLSLSLSLSSGTATDLRRIKAVLAVFSHVRRREGNLSHSL